jgi:hypothetical protein
MRMFSDRYPLILEFIFKHASSIGSCFYRFDAKRGMFYKTKRASRIKCLTMSFVCYSYILFVIARTVQAKLSLHPDFAMCYVFALGMVVFGFGFLATSTRLLSNVEYHVGFTLIYQSSLRFKSERLNNLVHVEM